MRNVLLALLIYLLFSACYAENTLRPLPADQAFSFSAVTDTNNQLILKWHIAPGYYLYRDEVEFTPAYNNQVGLGRIFLPAGKHKKDELHRAYQAYMGDVIVPLPLAPPLKGTLGLTIRYQGCSSAGFCYPPIKKSLNVNLTSLPVASDLTPYLSTMKANTSNQASVSNPGFAKRLLLGQHFAPIIFGFMLLGLLLAFTPCVLPMVPILSGIIVGFGKHISSRKAFFLSLSYVLGMALAYAVAGVLVAMMGSSVQVALQKPSVIIVFSSIFVLLALSLFGFYDLALPRSWHQRLVHHSNQQEGGSYLGVFLMGSLSTLIVSPCISAPLIGVLSYIANTGNMVIGGVALLSLGLGMGIPLLIFGFSAGKLLPKAGPWMNAVKPLFGFMMLALAIWMLSRVLSANLILFFWAVLAILAAVFIWRVEHSREIMRKLHQGLGLVVLSYGFILLGGAIAGQSDPLYLLSGSNAQMASVQNPPFVTVKNMDQLNTQFALAKSENKSVLLDFYADWCESCVIMDRHVFNQPSVINALSQFVVLRADVTHNDGFDQALLKRYQVIAPPTILFFGADGRQFSDKEIIGEVSTKEFIADINQFRYDHPMKFCKGNTRSC